MLDFYLRAAFDLVAAFIIVIIVLRLTGKIFVAQLTTVDMIGNMILAGMIGGLVYDDNVHITDFLIILTIWLMLMLAIHYLQDKSDKAKMLIIGAPIELIYNGKLISSSLDRTKIDPEGLLTLLRMKDVNSISDVLHAQMEPNGEVSVIKKGEPDFANIIVNEGAISEIALKRINKNEEWLMSELNKMGYSDLSSIYFIEYYNGKMTVFTNKQADKANAELEKQLDKEVLIDPDDEKK